jgi:DNA polymerase
MSKELYNKIHESLKTLQNIYGDDYFFEKDLLNISTESESKNEKMNTPDLSTKGNNEAGVDPNWKKATEVDRLNSMINGCLKCPLGKTRNKFVFGSGNPDADIMIIGEAPGKEEDQHGLPFVGKAGQLLTKILEAIKLSRDDVYIANIIKCRPPNNRRPTAEEVAECEPYLQKQIDLIKPKFILSLGLTSIDTLLKKKHKMADTRGKMLKYHGIDLLVTYHPAALLRNPHWKKKTWEDVKMLRKLYDDYLNSK